ncbi:uncharacterized protein LOC131880191 [Tigriopus californicus]|uniref:uncharacterized protein LOC131880191 n=1 Tax=Tigriopus californicus TaxID=6832 RepID=UPI0027DA6253|nr:uncharacterized protein LOC131880191 [Tigriopus californicus]
MVNPEGVCFNSHCVSFMLTVGFKTLQGEHLCKRADKRGRRRRFFEMVKPVRASIPPPGYSNDVVFKVLASPEETNEIFLDHQEDLWDESQGERLNYTDSDLVEINYEYALARGHRKIMLTTPPPTEISYQHNMPPSQSLYEELKRSMKPLGIRHPEFKQKRRFQIPKDQNRYSEPTRVFLRMAAKALHVRQQLLHNYKDHVVRAFRQKTETDVIYLQHMFELVSKYGIYSILQDNGEIESTAKALVIDPCHLEAELEANKIKPSHFCRNFMICFVLFASVLIGLVLVFNGRDHFFDMSHLIQVMTNATQTTEDDQL